MGYKLDGKNIEFPTKHMNIVGKGVNGNVYNYRGMALKLFIDDKNPAIDVETAEYLKNIDTERVLLPQNLLFYNNTFKGYTYKLVNKRGSGKRMIMLSKDEFIQNIEVLENDVELLSKEHVLLNGMDIDNVLFNGKLYVIDPTKYSILEEDELRFSGLEDINKFQLHLLLVNLITSELKKNNFSSNLVKKVENILLKSKDSYEDSSDFFDDIIGNNNTIKEFVKKL